MTMEPLLKFNKLTVIAKAGCGSYRGKGLDVTLAQEDMGHRKI
jgi:hypothetical protein